MALIVQVHNATALPTLLAMIPAQRIHHIYDAGIYGVALNAPEDGDWLREKQRYEHRDFVKRVELDHVGTIDQPSASNISSRDGSGLSIEQKPVACHAQNDLHDVDS